MAYSSTKNLPDSVKTDWVLTDFFNAEDFNRIRDNIIAIRLLSLQAFKIYDILDIDTAT